MGWRRSRDRNRNRRKGIRAGDGEAVAADAAFDTAGVTESVCGREEQQEQEKPGGGKGGGGDGAAAGDEGGVDAFGVFLQGRRLVAFARGEGVD